MTNSPENQLPTAAHLKQQIDALTAQASELRSHDPDRALAASLQALALFEQYHNQQTELHRQTKTALDQETARRRQAENDSHRRAIEVTILAEISRQINATHDLPTVLKRIATRAKELLLAESVVIIMRHSGKKKFEHLLALGSDATAIKELALQPGQGILGHLLQTGRAELIENTAADPRLSQNTDTYLLHKTLMGAPLLARHKVIGLIALWRTTTLGPFAPADLDFLVAMSRQAAIALENARLFNDADEARLAAEAANKTKSTFLAKMSHELRTPLNSILGFAQLLSRSPMLDPASRDTLNIIRRSGEHLLVLINDILDYAKLESGQATLNEKDVDLFALLDSLKEMFQLQAEEKRLLLNFQRDGSVPHYIRTDEAKLRQVLINLVSNALKFTHAGRVTVRINRAELPSVTNSLLASSYALLHFEVEDTGPGIAANETDDLFQAFRQTTTGRQAPEGTGLGLAVSYQFVQMMGGKISVSSRPGHGATFKFNITVGLVDPGAVKLPQPQRRIIGLQPQQPRHRILIVDDQPSNRELLARLLGPIGFELEQASNGQAALEIWQRWSPHLVLLDLRMPGLDGYQVARQISGVDDESAAIVVAVTAVDENPQAILAAGCAEVVRKPFTEQAIFDALQRHLHVQYLYDDFPADCPASRPDHVNLAQIPAQTQAQLTQAARQTDMGQINDLINQLRPLFPHEATLLAGLAYNFEYDQILSLLSTPHAH